MLHEAVPDDTALEALRAVPDAPGVFRGATGDAARVHEAASPTLVIVRRGDCGPARLSASWMTLALMRRPPEMTRQHSAPLTGGRRHNDLAN